MAIALLSENVDAISCLDRKSTDRTQATSTYFKTLPAGRMFISAGTRDQEDFLNSILKMAKTLTDPIDPMRIATSAVVTFGDYPTLARATQQYEISRDAEDFINKQKKAVQYRKDILIVADKVSSFLKREGIEAKMSIDLFTDPEYSDWVESKIRIEVPEDELKRTYGIYTELLSHSLKGIHKKTLRQLLVTIESR